MQTPKASRARARRSGFVARLFGVLAGIAACHAGAEDLTVSAAASLADAFADIGKAFEATHPGARVVFNFAASDVLLRQIEQGAPVDAFASADEATMDRAAAAGRIARATRQDFAANALVLIAPIAGPLPAALADLRGGAWARIAIGNPDSVPAGRYARQALTEAGLWDALQAKLLRTQNVRQTLDYVARGEADAGFVYATDAMTQAQKVRVAFAVPTANAVRYPAAATQDCAKAPLACEFVHYLLSAPAQKTLARYGFTAP